MVPLNFIFTVTAIVIGSSLQFGYQTGVVNAPIEIIESFINKSSCSFFKIPLNHDQITTISSLIVAAFPLGGLVGAMVGGFIANKFGRKLGMMITSIPTAIGSVIMTISLVSNWYPMLIIGRFIIGISCGIYTGLAPMYLTEIAPLKLKGASGTINQFFIVIGVLLSQVFGLKFILGTEQLWPYLLGLSLVPCIIQLVLLVFCPESPSYLFLTKNDTLRARDALVFLRNTEDIDDEFEELNQEKLRSISSNTTLSLKQILSHKHLRLGIWISIGMQLSQQLSGINSVIFYSNKIFVNAGFTVDTANYATIGVGAINVAITLLSVILVDKLGRKTLHLVGLIGMFFSAMLLSLSLIFQKSWNSLVYFAMVFIFSYVGFFGIGPGAIPWFIVAEMFVQESRAGAIGVSVFVNWVAQIAIGLGYPKLLTYLDNYSFLPFVGFLLIFIIFTYLFVPETKGKTPEEMENHFKRKVDGLNYGSDTVLINNSIGPLAVDDNDYRI